MGPKGGPATWGAEGGGPKGGGPKGGGPKAGSPEFRAFSLSRSPCSLFFSLWGSSRGILVVFEAPGYLSQKRQRKNGKKNKKSKKITKNEKREKKQKMKK